MRIATEEVLHRFDDLGHARHTADQNHFVNFIGFQTGIRQGLAARLDGLLHQIVDKRFQLGAGQLDGQMLWPRLIGGDEGQVHFRLHRGRKLDLRLFSSLFQTLQGEAIIAQIDALILLELVAQEIHDTRVEIFAAKERVAVRGLHFENAIADFKNGNVERAAAKVINRDCAGLLLFQTIGQRSCRRLVDDAQHLKARNLAGILRRLTLAVVEIGGNGDHSLRDLFAQISFSRFLHLHQDKGRDFRRGIIFAAGINPGVTIAVLDDLIRHHVDVFLDHRIAEVATDQTLDGEQSIFGIRHRLTLRALADQTLATGRKSHDRRGRVRAFGVGDNLGRRAFHHRDAGVGGPKVDSDNFCHCLFSFTISMLHPPVPRALVGREHYKG